MKFEVEDRGDYQLVRCSGVLGSGMGEYAGGIVHPLIENEKSRVLVDLSGVDRITSEGLGVFVTLVARANTKGSRVVFVCPSRFVRAVFDTTKIDRFLETEDTFEKGVERLLDDGKNA
jgi:anti-anti-sigma factor